MPASYQVGRGKPPKHGQFKPGVSGNPKGRKKRDPADLGKIISEVLNARVAVRKGRRVTYVTRREWSINALIESAVKGDLSAIEYALEFRAHAERFGDVGTQQILITDWLPDSPGQTAEQKTRDVAAATARVEPWWQSAQATQRRRKAKRRNSHR